MIVPMATPVPSSLSNETMTNETMTNETYPLFVQEYLDADMVSNSITHGSMDEALFHNTSYYACDYNVSRGIWYHHAGDGSLLTVEACSTDFEVEVAIFTGNCT